MDMAERIKDRRNAMGYTQEELGNKLGLQKSAIAKYENGRVENIKRSVIGKMAKILDCSPAYLMGWDDVSDTSADPSADPSAAAASSGAFSDPQDAKAAHLYHQLDNTDKGRVIERMETMLEADKYQEKEGSLAG